MTKQYKEITNSISKSIKELGKNIPDVISRFSAMSQAVTQDGVLDKKTKELIALALGVAGHCDGCIGFHTQALNKLGASEEEVAEALGIAIYMGGGPSLMYAAEAMNAFQQAKES